MAVHDDYRKELEETTRDSISSLELLVDQHGLVRGSQPLSRCFGCVHEDAQHVAARPRLLVSDNGMGRAWDNLGSQMG